MFKKKILEKVQVHLNEWLLGFNDNNLSLNIFSSEKFNLKNSIINHERVNEELKK